MVFVLDNYDSFTYNLVQYIGELGAKVEVRRNDEIKIEEIWYFLAGRGEMWREQEGRTEVLEVSRGLCLTIPLGTRFQFRSFGDEPLAAIGATMPPWPGEGEALVVEGPWLPTVP